MFFITFAICSLPWTPIRFFKHASEFVKILLLVLNCIQRGGSKANASRFQRKKVREKTKTNFDVQIG